MKAKIKTLLATLCTASALAFASTGASAQSIDLGRGELPVTVPAGYDANSPAPLIVLLHGYTSSGKMQDSYMGFSKIADDYGFFLAAPETATASLAAMRIASGMPPLPAATSSARP